MTVEVINMQGGGQGDATLFSDTMATPDQPFLIGSQWEWNLEPNNAIGYSGQNIAGSFNRIVGPPNGLQVTNPTGGNTLPKGFAIPRPLSWNKLNGRNQFAEYVVAADNSVPASVTRMGPMVLCDPNVGACYWLELVVETGPFLLNIGRWVLGATTNIANTGANGFAIGDRVSLTASISGGVTTLTYFRNGVSTLQFVDNSGSQLTTGMPGFHVDGCSSTRAQTIQNFRAGILGRF